jgi:hypothetical protein
VHRRSVSKGIIQGVATPGAGLREMRQGDNALRNGPALACLVMLNSAGYDRDVSVQGELMEAQQSDKDKKQPKTSAHVCPQCGFSINLKYLGLRAGATGVVTCSKCDWSGPIEIQIVDRERAD